MNIENVEGIAMFPTLVTRVKNFLTPEQCKDIFDYAKAQNLKPHTALTNNSVSSHSIHNHILDTLEIDIPSCVSIKQELSLALQVYKHQTGINGDLLTNSWVNFQNIGSKLIKHTHPGSSISGAIYLNVNDASSKIYFYNPNPFLTITQTENTTTAFSYKYQWIKPSNGDLLLFPSWLQHGSDEEINNTIDRAVLSFNTEPKYE